MVHKTKKNKTPKGQSKKKNPEEKQLALYGTQDEEKQNKHTLGQKRNDTNLFTKINNLIFNKILGNKYIDIN